MPRARNTATVGDVAKIMRHQWGSSFPHHCIHADPEKIASRGRAFLEELAAVTKRPTKKVLYEAATKTLECTQFEAHQLSERLVFTMHYIKKKGWHMTSGARLTPSVRSVLNVMQKKKMKAKEETTPKLPKEESSEEFVAEESRESSEQIVKDEVLPDIESRHKLYQLFGLSPPKHLPLPDSSSPDKPAGANVKEESDGEQEPQPSQATTRNYTQYLDAGKCHMVRLFDDGSKQTTALQEGPASLCVAVFEGEEAMETEVPNLVLASLHQTEGVVRRKPAAASSSLKKSPSDTMGEARDVSKAYVVMHYRDRGYALRQAFGAKRQVFQLSYSKAPREEVQGLAEESCKRLRAGEEEDSVKEWAKTELGKLISA